MKIDRLIQYLSTSLPVYRTNKNLPADAAVVLEFLGNAAGVVRFHCGGLVSPTTGDFVFTGTAIQKITSVAPLVTIPVLVYENEFSTNLSAMTTRQEVQPGFLSLTVLGAAQVTVPSTYTAEVRYQLPSGVITAPIVATYSLVSGQEYASISEDGVLTPRALTADGVVKVQAVCFAATGRKVATKNVVVKATVAHTPQAMEIFGPATLSGGSSGLYIAAIRFADGTSETVVPSWSVNRSIARISPGGALTVRNILNQVAQITVTATVVFQGVTYTANFLVSVQRVGGTSAQVRVGVKERVTGGDLATLLNSLSPVTPVGARQVQVTINAGQTPGFFATLAWPDYFGVATRILNLQTGSEIDFAPPVAVTGVFLGELTTWLVYQTRFENKSGEWEVQ